ncbi:MAG: hypothetical protein JSU73_11785 [candidate division WOR-3 bacterium]|nr:MAG: hypothetical protein JSU73_11785 [candidate division WOR-3 bacterium]
MTLRRVRWILVFGLLAASFFVTLAFLWIRIRLGPPNPEVRKYIEENPEVFSTLPQGDSEEDRGLDDSIAAARLRLLARAAPRLPLAEQGELLALREKMEKPGRKGVTRGEMRRMLELESECMRLLTPTELEEWRSTMQRLHGQAEGSAGR